MCNDDGEIRGGSLRFSVPEFIKCCKTNGANPSAMICALLAKVSYALNPEQTKDIIFGLSVAAKKMLGIENSIANAVGVAIAYTSRDEIENRSIADVAQKIRRDVDTQRSADYYITAYRLFRSYRQDFNFAARTVTYLGNLEVGENREHIVDQYLESNGNENLFLLQAGDSFYMSLTYGKATEQYLCEFLKVFDALGIPAEIMPHARAMDQDVYAPVL
jgi:hypothetical protein